MKTCPQLVTEAPVPLTQGDFCLSQTIGIKQQVQHREGTACGDAEIDRAGRDPGLSRLKSRSY